MQKATGLKVNAFFATDYAGMIEAMRFNKVQVAWFGNKSAMEAVDRANGEVFAQIVAKDGTEGYYSLLIVHKDSPFKSLDDVLKNGKALTFGFGDPNSTCGIAVPELYVFAPNGVDPKDFKTVRSQPRTNLFAVVNKQVDVATNNTENWYQLAITKPENWASSARSGRSPLIPSDPLVWRKDLARCRQAKMQDFLLAYGKSEAREKQILQTISYSGFRAVEQRAVHCRSASSNWRASAARSRATRSLASDERARKLSDIDTQMAEYSRQLKRNDRMKPGA